MADAMTSLRATMRAFVAFARRDRHRTRVLAIGVLVYVATIAVIGGIDVSVGPLRFRSRETDWLLRLVALVAVADLLVSRNVTHRLRLFAEGVPGMLTRARPFLVRTVAGLVAIGVLLWSAVRLIHGIPAETPQGDFAVLELYTRYAVDNELLVGPYSRFGWHHPGPAMFYFYKPLYELSGHRFESLRISALLLNIGCLAGLLAIIRRYGSAVLLLTATVSLGVHLLRIPDMIVSPWNPHLLVVPLAFLLVTCAAVLEGRVAFFAVATATASFIVQTHLSVAPTVTIVMGATLVWLIAHAVAGPVPLLYRRWLNVALWIGVAIWLQPFAQEISSPEGNLSAVYRSFLQEAQPGPDRQESYAAFFRLFTAFLLPGFETPWGAHSVQQLTWVRFVLAIVLLLGLAGAARHFARNGKRFGATFAMLLLAASLVALWSVQRIQGGLLDMLVFWITIIGALSTACVIAAGIESLAARVLGHAREGLQLRRMATAAGISLVGLVLIVGVRQLYDTSRLGPDETVRRIQEGATAVSTYLAREGLRRPLIYITQPTWGDVAGIILILHKSGRPAAVEPAWVFMFGPTFAATGHEDCGLVFADAVRRRPLLQDSRYMTIMDSPELSIHAVKPPLPVK